MDLEVHAPPSISLRNRDWKALLELFDREDVEEIANDVHDSLRLLPPEPCWEDDPFDFLREYL
jgi:hypothetical protein